MARGDPRAAAKAEKRAHPHVSASTSPPAANGWLRSSVLEVSAVDCGCPSIFHTGSTRLNCIATVYCTTSPAPPLPCFPPSSQPSSGGSGRGSGRDRGWHDVSLVVVDVS